MVEIVRVQGRSLVSASSSVVCRTVEGWDVACAEVRIVDFNEEIESPVVCYKKVVVSFLLQALN